MATPTDQSEGSESFHRQPRDALHSDDSASDDRAEPYSQNGTMSTVNLDEPSPSFGGNGAAASASSDSIESPFKSPVINAYSSGAGSYSHQQPPSHPTVPGLTASGAYPRPQPSQQQTTLSKVDQVRAQVKEFTVDTFKTTKQLVTEILGKGTRTVDPQLDTAIGELRVLQSTYIKVLEQTSNLQSYFSNVIYTQKQLTNTFGELSQRDPKLAEDFNCNAETLKALIKSGEQLLGALNFFMSNLRTFCHKTIQDCLDTIKKYEMARLQYDTYRTEHESAIRSNTPSSTKTAEIRQKYEERKRKYEQLKSDVTVKMQFLEENKMKVVHRQMTLFHTAICAYSTGNRQQLDSVMSQFSIKLNSPNSQSPSWLEK